MILIKFMKLDKTLGNLRKSRIGFFNLTDYFVNCDLLKKGLVCFYRISGNMNGINKIVINNFTISDEPHGYFGKSKRIVFDTFCYCFINDFSRKEMTLLKQLYIGDYNKLKKIYNL